MWNIEEINIKVTWANNFKKFFKYKRINNKKKKNLIKKSFQRILSTNIFQSILK